MIKKQKEVKVCKHRKLVVHIHGRRGYTHGKTKHKTKTIKTRLKDGTFSYRTTKEKINAKPFFYGCKKVTEHCKECGRILKEWKNKSHSIRYNLIYNKNG